jgi:hypothetical protein
MFYSWAADELNSNSCLSFLVPLERKKYFINILQKFFIKYLRYLLSYNIVGTAEVASRARWPIHQRHLERKYVVFG